MAENNLPKTRSYVSFIFFWLIASFLIGMIPVEVFAFATPIVTKANSIRDNLILIAKACVGVGIIVFVFSLIISRPMWKLCVCLLAVGVIVGAFTSFYGFIVN
jgi:hypothetical protein